MIASLGLASLQYMLAQISSSKLSEHNQGRTMVRPPKKFKERDAVRAIVEMLAQGFPITAGLARFYQETHPSKTQEDFQRWCLELTQGHNALRTNHDALHEDRDATRQAVNAIHSQFVWAWGAFLAEGTFGEGQGVSSVADTGIGRRTITFVCDTLSPHYALVVTPDHGDVCILAKTPGGFSLAFEENGEPIEPEFSFVVYAN